MKVQFLKSAVAPEGFPNDLRPEVAFAGRSNSGKSSVINAWVGAKVAKVSQAAGKTRLLNFFNVGEHYRLVDMPGYGYASRGAGERDSWAPMIETYIETRPNLCGLLLIMDMRRDWSPQEQLIIDWMSPRGLPVVVILNKTDKLGRAERNRQLKKIEKISGLKHVFCVSAFKKQGIEELEEFIYKKIVRPFQMKAKV